MRLQLRGYQEDGEKELRDAFRQGYKAPLYALPTGGGKTVIYANIAEKAGEKGNRVMILSHRKELVGQTSKALSNLGVRHSIIAPNDTVHSIRQHQMRENGHSQIDQLAPLRDASIQTLVNRLERETEPDLIIIDEAHHAVAGQWAKVIEAFPNARLLGVTATPHRLDGKGLGADAGGPFDLLVEGPTIDQLIQWGYLCRPAVYAPPMQADLEGVKKRGGDYARGEAAEAMDKPRIIGDAVQHYERICPGDPAIAFCTSVQHAEHVAERFRQAGYRWQCVDGNMSAQARDRAIRGLGDGTLHGISSCEIVNEGTDVPIVKVAILLRPTQSLSLYLQQVGRVLRPYPGKDRAVILDHVDNVRRHGLPDQDREWSLQGEKGTGKGGKGSKAPPPPPVQTCPQCYAAHEPAPKCPACGFQYPGAQGPQEVEGELTEITPEQAEAMKREKRKEVAKAASLEDLKAIEKTRGYKPGWADHVWKARKRKGAAA